MSLPKVLIDASPLTSGFKNRGIGNQIYSLLTELLNNKQYQWQILAHGTKSEFLETLEIDQQAGISLNFEFFSIPIPNLPSKLLAAFYFQVYYLPQIKKANPDLLLSFIPDKGLPHDIPTIVIIPDITPLQTGVFSQKSWLANLIKKRNYEWAIEQVKSASKILTISEFAKEQIGKSLGIPLAAIGVTPLAVPTNFITAVGLAAKKSHQEINYKRRILNTYNITEPYILYTGGLEANKNVGQILQAFALLINNFPDLKLVITGKEFKLGWDHKPLPLNERAKSIMDLAAKLKIQHKIIFTGFVDQNHLPTIIQFAQCFVHLSKLEGFGLSVLEPQIVGTPVVASNSSTYPEILGNSAILVDPDSASETAKAINSLIANSAPAEQKRKELIAKAKENVKRFSWARTAELTMTEIKAALIIAPQPKPEEKSLPDNKQAKVASKPKAAVIASYFHPFRGGMEQVALDSAKFLAESGYEVTVFTSDRKSGKIVIDRNEAYDFETGKLQIKRLRRLGKNYYFYLLAGLATELQQLNPDVVHMHGFGFFGHDLGVLRYKLFTRPRQLPALKVINTPHGPFMAKSETGLRQILKLAWTFTQKLYLFRILDLVIAENHEQFTWINTDYNIPTSRIKLLTPVMPQTAMSSTKALALKSQKPEVLIVSICRMSRYKGLDTLVEAFGLLNSSVATKLIIAGATDDFTAELKTLARENLRAEDISVETDITDERRSELLSKASIFVLASEWEAFGIVIAEAMAYHCAIVSSDTEGSRFLIKPGSNGLVFNYADYRSLADILNSLILDPKKLAELQKASADILPKYTYESVKTEYLKLLDKISA